ncbi:GFA family protein [Achromobacter marplatensis]
MQQGSCHCGQIEFEVDGDVSQVLECNCSHCSRKGYLLWFVPRAVWIRGQPPRRRNRGGERALPGNRGHQCVDAHSLRWPPCVKSPI